MLKFPRKEEGEKDNETEGGEKKGKKARGEGKEKETMRDKKCERMEWYIGKEEEI